MSASASPPILVTADESLAGEVLRLAAAAGCALDVLADPVEAVRRWSGAPAVLVGADLAGTLGALAPSARPGVRVLSLGTAPDVLFRAALDLSAASVLELPRAAGWLVEELADLGDDATGDGLLIAVTGGSGGVGASVLACALASMAASRASTALVDLDPGGPGLRRLAGFDALDGVTWADLAESPGRIGARALREALPRQGGLGILDRADLVPAHAGPVVRDVVATARRGHAWVVLDLPRAGEAPVADVTGQCDRVVLVVRAGVGQVVAAARAADHLRAGGASPAVVVRARRRDTDRAEAVARAVGAPLLAVVPDQRRLDEDLDLGVGPVFRRRAQLTRVARALVEEWERSR